MHACEYLNGVQTRHLMEQLNAFFESTVGVPRIRIGGRQTIETLISEEALLLAKFLRDERRHGYHELQFHSARRKTNTSACMQVL